LFVEAAQALFRILTDPKTIRPQDSISIELEEEDTDQLLVAWLTELLFFHETEQWLFSRFDITSIDEKRIEARVWGEKLDALRHPIDREVKAVTYHRLGLVRDGNLLKTVIVFDL
jgi:SHS2 domain-containing protein